MQSLKMQPTFRELVPGAVDDVLRKLRQAIRSPELAGLAESAGPCVDFKIESTMQRIWSPHLSIHLSDVDSQTELFGRFSPRPEVWTMFMMCYFAAVFCVFVGATFGYAQWTLGTWPWALAAVPVGVVVIVSLHAISLVGQRLSADQMVLLRTRFDRACELAFGNSLEEPLE